jgi:hypothetical protein
MSPRTLVPLGAVRARRAPARGRWRCPVIRPYLGLVRWHLRVLGVLLILLFVVAVVWTVVNTYDCVDECHGNIVYGLICLLLALPAIVGCLLLVLAGQRGPDDP